MLGTSAALTGSMISFFINSGMFGLSAMMRSNGGFSRDAISLSNGGLHRSALVGDLEPGSRFQRLGYILCEQTVIVAAVAVEVEVTPSKPLTLRPNHGRSGDGERGERSETQECSSLRRQDPSVGEVGRRQLIHFKA